MPGRLTNKVAIVTGASSGIGRATSLALHKEGAIVVCSDLREVSRNESSNEPEIGTHDLINKEGGQAIFVKADVSKSEEVAALVDQAVQAFGRLDM
jgi:NAD(P)-dependent dehydrogenase (short-subunit alcohol dehydrogenase family)